METSRIISEAIKNNDSSKVNIELKRLLLELESVPVETLTSYEFWKSDDKLFDEIAKIICDEFYILNLKDKSENEKIHRISSVISTITPYLTKAIENNDLKSLIIFLLVKRNEINVIELLENEKISEKDCYPILNKLADTFQTFKYEIFAPCDASYSDKKIFELIEDAFNNDNIDQFYSEFRSIEDGAGLDYYLIEKILEFIKSCDFSIFLKILSNTEGIFSIILFLQNLDEYDLIKVTNGDLRNKWLNIELTRQILKKEKENFTEESYIAIKNVLGRIHEEDYEFFKKAVKYFNKSHPSNKSNLFNASLGSLLASVPNSEIEEIFNECFVIDRYDFHLHQRTLLLNRFIDNVNENKLKFFLSLVFEKWDEFLKLSFESEEFYLSGLMLTDFCNFIIYYYKTILKDEEIINQIYTLFKSMEYIDSEWFISLTNQITKLSLYYSKIFLLSYVYYEKELNNTEIKKLFLDFKENEIIIHNLSRMDEEKFEKSLKEIDSKLS